MARDVSAASMPLIAPRKHFTRVLDLLARVEILPKSQRLGAVQYSPLLVAYVTVCCSVALGLSIWLVRPVHDWVTLAAGSAIVFLMSLFAVRVGTVMKTAWTPSVLVHLGLCLALGPIAGLACGAAESLGVSIRSRNGWFRTAFNLSDHFLSNVAAWAVWVAIAGGGAGAPIPLIILGSLCAGLAHYVVNYGMLTGVIEIAESQPPIRRVLQRWASRLPYSVGYGLSAWTLVLLYRLVGVVGFIALVIPVILLQGFLVLFARRVEAYEAEQAAHQKEREALLQQAVDASEAERRRIARDLHDGVVQNLAGMAFTLTATASELKDKGDLNGNAALLDLLENSAEETRAAMKDLRTLIIEIAPPTLRREGLHAALLEVLRTIEGGGTQTRLELPSNMRLRQDRASLIFRVAQEVLRNVAAHAEAKHVSVTLKEVNKMAVLRITDDGKGFTQSDVARRRAEGHVGTNAIVELAEEAGGTLDIHSQPGKGTRVTLKVPTE